MLPDMEELSVLLPSGDHGSAPSRAESKDCGTGGQLPGGKEQAGCRSVQMGRQWERHHRAGQADVHDHDGDDRLHAVSTQAGPSALQLLLSPAPSIYSDPCSPFRGKGPLKNTSDVISAAKKIAEAGSRMDKLGRTIADHVSDTCRVALCVHPESQKQQYFSWDTILISQTVLNS